MVLYSLDGKKMDSIPYEERFNLYKSRLNDEDFKLMQETINNLIDNHTDGIFNAGWLPGADWEGTPFQPIYIDACRSNYEESAKFFGQLVWHVIMQRTDNWMSDRFEMNGKPNKSRTYFRKYK